MHLRLIYNRQTMTLECNFTNGEGGGGWGGGEGVRMNFCATIVPLVCYSYELYVVRTEPWENFRNNRCHVYI